MENPSGQQELPARLPDGSPDWSAIQHDVLCARCDYNLRTLSTPRCPECGLTFEWAEVLDRAERHDEFLFEHAWRRRPFRAWMKTAWKCLWPTSFWRHVSIHERVHVGSLLLFIAVTVPASLVLFFITTQGLVHALVPVINYTTQPIIWPRSILYNQPWQVRTHFQLDRLSLHPHRPILDWLATFDYRFWLIPTGMVLGVLGIVVILSALHQTLSRTRVRRAQLIRVAAYATPAMCFWGFLLLMFAAATLPFSSFRGPIPFFPGIGRGWPPPPGSALIITDLSPLELGAYFAIVATAYGSVVYFIGVPLRDYLRLPRPWRLASAAALAAALLPASILAVLSLYMTGSW
ncbi:MAG: hypothetical protein HZA51_10755 [Planctomycetes bacterium]|nr:hypothetical protein [Planctomycetota bacterium]